ncbi:MAG: hypothetical protein JJ934_02245 [Pseudomonadales bacterium]|nr:hypothetical protein [Pseudomonadales bacterium]MBO6655683.1 hypothetical protein [Pseudomonadales bacterium]
MSAGHCCRHTRDAKAPPEIHANHVRPNLFNWLTVLLLIGWVGIVTVALETAGAENLSAMPTLEVFLRTLLS